MANIDSTQKKILTAEIHVGDKVSYDSHSKEMALSAIN